MTLEELQKRNDFLRTTLRGATVYYTPSVFELDSRMRGRLLYRLTLYDRFHPESDHSEGTLIWAGLAIWWRIEGETLTFGTAEDL